MISRAIPPLLLITSASIGLIRSCQPDTSASHIRPIQAACLTTLPVSQNVPSGNTLIGRNDTYPEEAPARDIQVKGFIIDATEVTNAQFKLFVDATGYVTDAEKKQAGFNVPGGAVFTPPSAKNPSWWQFVEGSNWQHPEGPDSTIEGRDYEPVVQVSLKDARAYAAWANRRLPTDVEWEYAAKAGAETLYVWGDEKAPSGKEQANTWQGAFPVTNTKEDGYLRRAPVGCFEPNKFGLYDMIGNVWEWTDTPYVNNSDVAQYVIKGGSFLCAPNFCRRYRASAIQPQDADFTTNHIGFRTVKSRMKEE